MTHFNTTNNHSIQDEELNVLFAIYGHDTNEKSHFLVIGSGADDEALVVDISSTDYVARVCDNGDSALEVAEYFGLVSNIKFFYDNEDFDLTVEF